MALLDRFRNSEAGQSGELALAFMKEIFGEGGEDNRARIQGIQDELKAKSAEPKDNGIQTPSGARYGDVGAGVPQRDPNLAFNNLDTGPGIQAPQGPGVAERLAGYTSMLGPATPSIPQPVKPQAAPTAGMTSAPAAGAQAPANVQQLLGLAGK